MLEKIESYVVIPQESRIKYLKTDIIIVIDLCAFLRSDKARIIITAIKETNIIGFKITFSIY